MARLYADECFSRPVVEELRKLGQDVLTAHTLVMAHPPDRPTFPDRRSPVRRGETFGQSPGHGQETVPQQATKSFSRPVVEELRKLGHDVLTAHTLVVARSPDRATCPDRRSPVRRGNGSAPSRGQV